MEGNNKLNDSELYEMAKKRVKVKKDFLSHLFSYISVNLVLFAINMITSSHHLWFYWVTLWWGVGLACHGVNTYNELNLDESAVRKEMEKLKNNHI